MTPVPADDLPSNAVPAHDMPDHLTGPGPSGEKVSEAQPAPSFPRDDPKYSYGSILPLAQNKETGELSLAAPEIIRAPMRGLEDMSTRLRGPVTPEMLHGLNPDEQSAFLALGGMRPSGIGLKPTPSPVRPMAVEAREAGYVLLPSSISDKPGLVSRVLAGWSGKIKTQQAASAHNQSVTNRLAAKALGLPEDTALTDEVFNKVRQQAGRAYQAVIDSVPMIRPDADFKSAVSDLGGRSSQAAKHFPNLMKNPGVEELVQELGGVPEFTTQAGVELVKQLRFEATSNLKALGDPKTHSLGLAQRQAADLIDDLMDRNIEKAGKPGLIDAYRAARKLIAKAYDTEAATNTATGDVNARGLARLADKGRPLSGELDTIARSAASFPRAMQSPAGFGDNEAWSALDFFGSAAALAHGNPTVAATIMGRPLARAAVLSRPMQNALTRSGDTRPGAGRILPPGGKSEDKPEGVRPEGQPDPTDLLRQLGLQPVVP